jgi:hypothetical protein
MRASGEERKERSTKDFAFKGGWRSAKWTGTQQGMFSCKDVVTIPAQFIAEDGFKADGTLKIELDSTYLLPARANSKEYGRYLAYVPSGQFTLSDFHKKEVKVEWGLHFTSCLLAPLATAGLYYGIRNACRLDGEIDIKKAEKNQIIESAQGTINTELEKLKTDLLFRGCIPIGAGVYGFLFSPITDICIRILKVENGGVIFLIGPRFGSAERFIGGRSSKGSITLTGETTFGHKAKKERLCSDIIDELGVYSGETEPKIEPIDYITAQVDIETSNNEANNEKN